MRVIEGLYRLTLNPQSFLYLRLYEDGLVQCCRGSSDDSAGWLNRAHEDAMRGTYKLIGDIITLELSNRVLAEITMSGRGIVKSGGLNLVLTHNHGQQEGGRFEKIKRTAPMARIEAECIRTEAAKTTEDRIREAERDKSLQEFSRQQREKRVAIQALLAPRQKQLAEAFARSKNGRDNFVLAAVIDSPVEIAGALRLFIIDNERCRPYNYGFWSVEVDVTGEHLERDSWLGMNMWISADGTVMFDYVGEEPPGTQLMYEWYVETKGDKELIFHYAGSESARFRLP